MADEAEPTTAAHDHALAMQLQQQEADGAGLVPCATCTFLNSSQRAACEVCGQPLRGGAVPSSRRKQRSDASHLLNFEQAQLTPCVYSAGSVYISGL